MSTGPLKVFELQLQRGDVRGGHTDEVHLVGEQLAGEADVDSGFLFVAGEHPNLDARFGQ